jgi:hypothetical protein
MNKCGKDKNTKKKLKKLRKFIHYSGLPTLPRPTGTKLENMKQ